jgi:hypothetical protein
MTLEQYLKEVKGRSEKATKGPWWAVTAGTIWSGKYGDSELVLTTCGRSEVKAANAEYVCHSRTDIDKLAAMVEMLTDWVSCPDKFKYQSAEVLLEELDRMAGE